MNHAREWTLDGHAGRLAARTWWGDREPTHLVLVSHGFAEHSGRYAHVADALIAHGAVVHAVDHVGHGRSDGERGLVMDFEKVVDDLHGVDRRAREENPGLPVVLVGHSMGGLVAARYAQRHTDSLAGLVLSGPLVGRWDAGPQLLGMAELPDDLRVDGVVLSRDPEVGRSYTEDPLVYHGSLKRPTIEAMVRGLEAISAGPSLGRLPLWWGHGGADVAMSPDDSRHGIEHLRGERLVEKIYPGGLHEIFNELDKATVLADVNAFIEQDVLASA